MERKRFLIIRLSSIGDILLTTPFIRLLRKRFDDALIDYLVKDEHRELLEHNPYLDEIHPFKAANGLKEIRKWRKFIRQKGYSEIFDLHRNLRSILMTGAVRGVKVRRVNKRLAKRFLLTKFGINLYRNITPVPERYLETASAYGIVDDGKGLDLFPNKNIDIFNRTRSSNRYKIAMAPGAGYYTKRWPIEYYAELGDNLIENADAQIILIGSTEDKPTADEIKRRMKNEVRDLTGDYTILETAAIIKTVDAVVTNDSGLMHVAVSQDVPVVSFFGSTTEELGFFPYNDNSKVLEVRGLKCRPCTHIGRESCPLGHFNCMKEITPTAAYEAVVGQLSRKL